MRETGRLGFVVIRTFFDYPAVKATMAALAAAWTWFFPMETTRQLLLSLIVAMILDTVTGLVAARAMGKPIESARFGRVIIKLVAYYGVALIMALVGKQLPGVPIAPGLGVSFAAGAALMTEAISVLENCRNMLKAIGKDTSFIDNLLNRSMAALSAAASGKTGDGPTPEATKKENL